MLFAKHYVVGNAVGAWKHHCTWHPEGDHTGAAMKDLLYCQVVLTKHRTGVAFQNLHSAKQGRDQNITSYGAYIVTTY